MDAPKESLSRVHRRPLRISPRRRTSLPVEGWAAIAAVGFILLIVLATLPRLPW
jgi:hypothetical protein